MSVGTTVVEVRFEIPGDSPSQDGVVDAWLVTEGDRVRKGQTIAEVGSDKVTLEITSPCDGEVIRIECPEGEEVEAGGVLALIQSSVASSE